VTVTTNNTDVNVANPTATITFAFSEAPQSFTFADTTAVGGTLSNLQQVDATHYTATFTAAANTEISNGSVSVTSGSWSEGNGNPGTSGSTGNFVVDTVPPITVTSVTYQTSNPAKPTEIDHPSNDSVLISVHFSADVFVTGSPTLTLNINQTGSGAPEVATYQSGSGTDTLVFFFTPKSR